MVWIFLAITGMLSALILILLHKLFSSTGSTKDNQNIKTVLSLLVQLVEVHVDFRVQTILGKLIFSIWAIMMIVISNAYKGLIVVSVTSPLALNNYPQNLSDLVTHNLTIFTRRSTKKNELEPVPTNKFDNGDRVSESEFGYFVDNQRWRERFAILLIYKCDEKLEEKSETIQEICKNVTASRDFRLKVMKQIVNVDQFELRYTFDKLNDCDKSVYMGNLEEMTEFVTSRILGRRSWKNKNEFFNHPGFTVASYNDGWIHVDEFGDLNVPRRLQFLFEAGLFIFWKRIENWYKYAGVRLKMPDMEISLSLSSNFVTLFYIFGSGLLLSGFVFVLERLFPFLFCLQICFECLQKVSRAFACTFFNCMIFFNFRRILHFLE